MIARPFLALAALAAGPAFAACPTAANLETTGVYIDFSDGTYVHYRRIKPELVGEATMTPDGVANFFTARYRGAFQLLDAELKGDEPDQDTLVSFQPAEGSDDIPWPEPGAAWSGTVVTQRADGSFVNNFEQIMRVTGAETVHISGCDYDALIITVEEFYESGEGASELRYIPALDIAYLTALGNVGQPYDEFFTPRLISDEAPR